MNLILISVFSAWLISQTAKIIISKKKRKFFETGGMPSSHSAFVSALSTSVGVVEGFSSTIFLVALAFSIVVLHDAFKIRKQHTIKDVVIGVLIGVIATLLINNFL